MVVDKDKENDNKKELAISLIAEGKDKLRLR
jgi:hypothetical protein